MRHSVVNLDRKYCFPLVEKNVYIRRLGTDVKNYGFDIALNECLACTQAFVASPAARIHEPTVDEPGGSMKAGTDSRRRTAEWKFRRFNLRYPT